MNDIRLARPVIAALAAGAIAVTPAVAQDWETARGSDGSALAFIDFDSGISLGFRCQNGSFGGMVIGLPPAVAANNTITRRPLQIFWDRDTPVFSGDWWISSNATVAMTDTPAPFARALRRGGDLHLVIPQGATTGGDLRYIVQMPPSYAALDGVLQECGRPLADPYDRDLFRNNGGLPDGIAWRSAPQIHFPRTEWNAGVVRVACITQADGRLTDCIAESEFPENSGFGAAALRGMGSARMVNSTDAGQPVPIGPMAVTIRFGVVDTPESSPLRTRLRRVRPPR